MKHAFFTFFAAAALVQACGPAAAANDASTDVSAAADVQTSGDAGAQETSVADAQPGTDAATSDAAATDAASTGHQVTAPTGSCFHFAAGTFDSSNPCDGELYTLSGGNVDLSSGGGSAMTLCDLPGPYASLAAVPTSYATCAWNSYIEGIEGLANHGLIVRDATAAHHYRLWIQSNTQPNLVFSWDAID